MSWEPNRPKHGRVPTLPPGPVSRPLRPPPWLRDAPPPGDPSPAPAPPDGPPDAPDGPPEPGAAPAMGVMAYCWPCKGAQRFERPAPGVPRRCTACRMPQGHRRPVVCTTCGGELPRVPEHHDAPGQARELFCTWRCLVVRRDDPEAHAICARMGWRRP